MACYGYSKEEQRRGASTEVWEPSRDQRKLNSSPGGELEGWIGVSQAKDSSIHKWNKWGCLERTIPVWKLSVSKEYWMMQNKQMSLGRGSDAQWNPPILITTALVGCEVVFMAGTLLKPCLWFTWNGAFSFYCMCTQDYTCYHS